MISVPFLATILGCQPCAFDKGAQFLERNSRIHLANTRERSKPAIGTRHHTIPANNIRKLTSR